MQENKNPLRSWAIENNVRIKEKNGVRYVNREVTVQYDFAAAEDGWSFPIGALAGFKKANVDFISILIKDFQRRLWITPDRAIEVAISRPKAEVVPQFAWTRNPLEFKAKDEKFAHLHVRSDYSYHESPTRIKSYCEKAMRLGQPGIAMTDRNQVLGTWGFRREFAQRKLFGICGATVNVSPVAIDNKSTDNHELVLLAVTQAGWQNLLELLSKAWLDGFYYVPRVDHSILSEHAEGIVCLTAGLQGRVLQGFAVGDGLDAEAEIQRLTKIYGERLYLEFAPWVDNDGFAAHGMAAMAEYAIKKDLNVVVTGDVQWLDVYDTDIARIVRADGRQKRLIVDPESLVDPALKTTDPDEYKKALESATERVEPELSPTHHLSTADELREMFERHHPGVDFNIIDKGIAATVSILDQSENYELDKSFKFPKDTSGIDPIEQSRKKLEADGLLKDPVYQERFDMEAKVIEELGYVPYFALLNNLMTFMNDHKIYRGPGRGSAAGSLIIYGLGITDLDPIKHGLYFQRFINKNRVGLPDVDIDVRHDLREEVYKFIIEQYPHTANIPTVLTMKGRSSIKSVFRALNQPLRRADILSKEIPDQLQNAPPNSLLASLQTSQGIIDFMKQEPEVFDMAMRLEGCIFAQGKHPAGIIISPIPLESNVGSMMVKKKGGKKGEVTVLIQADMGDVDKMGYIKMDILSSSTVTAVAKAMGTLHPTMSFLDQQKWLKNIKLDDEKVIKATAKGDTKLSFQFNSHVMRQTAQTIRVKCFDDMVALNAIVRPGASAWIDTYAKGDYKPPEKALWPIVENTRGVILYQEQAIRCASELAGMELAEADSLRKAIGKKLPELMRKLEAGFVSGCIKNGITEESAKNIFEILRAGQNYSFNLSHSASYALLAFWTLYLYVHYPAHYIAAYLNAYLHKKDQILTGLESIHYNGVELLPPDLNDLRYEFRVVDDKTIRLGAGCLPYVSEKTVSCIREAAEKHGKPVTKAHLKKIAKMDESEQEAFYAENFYVEGFEGFKDFHERVPGRYANKRAKKSLALAGTFSCWTHPRAAVHVFEEQLERKKTWDEEEFVEKMAPEPWTLAERVQAEVKGFGFTLTNPLSEHTQELKAQGWRPIHLLPPSKGNKLTGGMIRGMRKWTPVGEDKHGNPKQEMCKLEIDDGEGGGTVLIWSSKWAEVKEMELKIGDFVFVNAYLLGDDPNTVAVGDRGYVKLMKMFYEK